jgi:hypothetical protein
MAFHANVMKTLEANSIRTGKTDGEIAGMDILSKFSALTRERGTPVPIRNRYHLIQQIGKPRWFGQPPFKHRARKPRRDRHHRSSWVTSSRRRREQACSSTGAQSAVRL